MWNTTNIQRELIKTKQKEGFEAFFSHPGHVVPPIDEENVQQVFSKIKKHANQSINQFNADYLDREKIFHISQIKNVCITYRLRFLSVQYFKGKIPNEALFKIEKLEKEHQTDIQRLKIMAPSKCFKLENADDPLLFAPIGNGYYLLIHQWGRDLHPLRKLIMKPFVNLENFVMFIFFLSLLISQFIPMHLFTKKVDSVQTALLFLFTFKSIIGIAIFYGFALGKNFSEAIWNSKYDNS